MYTYVYTHTHVRIDPISHPTFSPAFRIKYLNRNVTQTLDYHCIYLYVHVRKHIRICFHNHPYKHKHAIAHTRTRMATPPSTKVLSMKHICCAYLHRYTYVRTCGVYVGIPNERAHTNSHTHNRPNLTLHERIFLKLVNVYI